MSPSRSPDDAMAEYYREDPEHAMNLLNDVLEDGDPGELRVTLQQIAKAFVGVLEEVDPAGVLAQRAQPSTLVDVMALLKVIGLRLMVVPMPVAGEVGTNDQALPTDVVAAGGGGLRL